MWHIPFFCYSQIRVTDVSGSMRKLWYNVFHKFLQRYITPHACVKKDKSVIFYIIAILWYLYLYIYTFLSWSYKNLSFAFSEYFCIIIENLYWQRRILHLLHLFCGWRFLYIELGDWYVTLRYLRCKHSGWIYNRRGSNDQASVARFHNVDCNLKVSVTNNKINIF